ncbi:hypothetical protein evm_011219 [Chilo suppressalis]|nr:hypothetical protein evm_011219 [Chilo suppressalis]
MLTLFLRDIESTLAIYSLSVWKVANEVPRLNALTYKVKSYIITSIMTGDLIQPHHCRRSASSPPLTISLDTDLEDDTTAATPSRLGIWKYSAMEVLGPLPGERTFTFSVTSEKHWRDKGGTDVADGVSDADDADVTDAASIASAPSEDDTRSSQSSIFSSIIPDKVSGSICTAVLFMLGWKLLANKR